MANVRAAPRPDRYGKEMPVPAGSGPLRPHPITGPSGHRSRPRPLLRNALGGVLRRIRVQQGRTLADVARAARVSVPYLSELERGCKEASSEVLAAICDALRIELPYLLAEVGRELVAARAPTAPRAGHRGQPTALAGGATRWAPAAQAARQRRLTGLMSHRHEPGGRRPAGVRARRQLIQRPDLVLDEGCAVVGRTPEALYQAIARARR